MPSRCINRINRRSAKGDAGKKDNTKSGKGPRPARDGKRTHDRKSGTGRGKEVKKGGGGAHNWGNDKNLARRNEGAIVEGEEDLAEDAIPEEREHTTVKVEEEPPEDKTISYDEYLKTKARPDNANFAPVKEREVTNEFANVKAAVAVEEDFFVKDGAKGQKKKGVKTVDEKQTIEVGFRVADPNTDRRSNNRRDGDRRNSGGRGRGGRSSGGRGRGGGGRGRGSGRGRGGGRGDSGLNVNDSGAFPSL